MITIKTIADKFYEYNEYPSKEFERYIAHQQSIRNFVEQDRMIDKIADRVIERLELKLDTSDALAKLEQLDKTIKNLGKN